MLWSFNYFLYNKRLKRIVFFRATAFSHSAPSEDEQTEDEGGVHNMSEDEFDYLVSCLLPPPPPPTPPLIPTPIPALHLCIPPSLPLLYQVISLAHPSPNTRAMSNTCVPRAGMMLGTFSCPIPSSLLP